MKDLKANETALIVIDVQNFYWEKETLHGGLYGHGFHIRRNIHARKNTSGS